MAWIIAFLGLAASIAGGGAIYMGWPLVLLERDPSLVIAGAALGAGGLVSLAIAVQIFETRRARLVLEQALTRWAAREDDAPSPRKRDEAIETARVSTARPAAAAAAPPPQAEEPRPVLRSEPEAGDEMQPARTFTVGETTFVVFTDGSIEAQTAEGNKRFRSMEEVRAYLETAVS